MSAIGRELGAIVGVECVLEAEVDRIAYQVDCWPRGIILARGRRLEANRPRAIVLPGSASEIARVIAWARRAEVAVVPYGAGSGVCGGALAADAITIDVKRLERITSIDEGRSTIRAEAGLNGMVFERELERRGLTVGHYPSSILCSSVGGWIAARGAGQYSSRYGKIEDMTRGLEVVSGRGQIERTGSMGEPGAWDATQIFVGSEGTLGVITEVELALWPRPSARTYRGFRFASVDDGLGAIRELMRAGCRPAVVRLYDAFDTLIAHRSSSGDEGHPSAPGLVDRIGSWLGAWDAGGLRDEIGQIARGVISRVMGNPLWINRAIEALPDDCLLVIGWEGDGAIEREEARWGMEFLGGLGLDLGEEPGAHWLKNRYSVSYKMSPMYASGAFVDTMEVSATWDRLGALYDGVRRALGAHALVMAHFSHAYANGCSIYFTFAGYGADLDETLERYAACWADGLGAAARSGGSISHHHGVGRSKAPWTEADHAGGRAHFERAKRRWDPDRIMNPGAVYPAAASEAR